MTGADAWYLDEESLLTELKRGLQRGSAAPRIPGYEGMHEIDSGGQGVVYEATQSSTGRRVAIKVLLEESFASDTGRRRFEREIDLAASLRHPNIVRVYDSGTTSDGRPYFVMEFIEGRSLDDHVQGLVLTEKLQCLAKVADGVHYAHQRGVIHRDLKPSNIRIDSDGQPHILDFGAARWLRRASGQTVSGTGEFLGSLPWATPRESPSAITPCWQQPRVPSATATWARPSSSLSW